MLARGEIFARELLRLDGRETRVEELGRVFGRLAEDDGVATRIELHGAQEFEVAVAPGARVGLCGCEAVGADDLVLCGQSVLGKLHNPRQHRLADRKRPFGVVQEHLDAVDGARFFDPECLCKLGALWAGVRGVPVTPGVFADVAGDLHAHAFGARIAGCADVDGGSS